MQKRKKNSKLNCFVRESVKETMKLKTTLTRNRMILICKGVLDFYIDDNVYNAKFGDVIFAFKNELIYAIANGECEYMYIDFDDENTSETFSKLNTHLQ